MPYLSAGGFDFIGQKGLIFSVDPYAAAYRIFFVRRD
ncbi:hypothetical protein BCV60_17000 [Bacillus halotolerans]|nr:hypothetical protein BCV60_17000 [Bacillus halotolerans]